MLQKVNSCAHKISNGAVDTPLTKQHKPALIRVEEWQEWDPSENMYLTSSTAKGPTSESTVKR